MRLPHAFGAPVGGGLIRCLPEDFRVEECLSFTPSGDGEHLMLRLRKSGWNTDALARWLAEAFGVPRSAVAYAGRKDRQAVTDQWFSVHRSGHTDLAGVAFPQGVACLEIVRNRRKLRPGAVAGNRFRLRVRELTADHGALEARLLYLAREGVPNFFGPQRFGRGGRNLAGARRWLLQGVGRGGKNVRGMYLSAARSLLFNQVLGERIHRGCWNRLVAGDRAMLEHTRSHFPVDVVTPGLAERCALGELHPSGPLPGVEKDGAGSLAVALEERALLPYREWVDALVRRGVDAARRPLRVFPRGLAWWFPGPDCVELAFELPSGAYATSVLREVLATRAPEEHVDGAGASVAGPR